MANHESCTQMPVKDRIISAIVGATTKNEMPSEIKLAIDAWGNLLTHWDPDNDPSRQQATAIMERITEAMNELEDIYVRTI